MAVSPLPLYQQGIDAHERGPAGVGGAEGAEAAGVGVRAAGPHQDGLQLGVPGLQLAQSLLHVALGLQHLQIVPGGGTGTGLARGPCRAPGGARTSRPLVPLDGVL